MDYDNLPSREQVSPTRAIMAEGKRPPGCMCGSCCRGVGMRAGERWRPHWINGYDDRIQRIHFRKFGKNLAKRRKLRSKRFI